MIGIGHLFVLAASVFAASMGGFGVIMHRNPIRMLLSLEVSFNGFLLLLLWSSWAVGDPVMASGLGLIGIGVSSAELALMVSIMMALFKGGYIRRLDEDELNQSESSKGEASTVD